MFAVYIYILYILDILYIRATPPARPHDFSEDIERRVRLIYIQGTLQHVSTEFLGNHQIRTEFI